MAYPATIHRAALYGPTKAQVAKVTAFLGAHGIKVTSVSANHTLIHTKAPTRNYEHALGIRINDYQLDGRSFYSTTDSPRIPRTIAPIVVGILGLNHGVQMHPVSVFTRPMPSAQGLSPYQTPPAELTDMNPLQVATAYNIPDITNPGNGSGVGIAIITAESQGVLSSSDFSDFWTAYGLPDHTINEVNIDGSPQTGGEGETWLDIEYAGAMGPGATLNVYMAADPAVATFTDAYNQMVEDNTSAVMTTSWGLADSVMPPSTIAADEAIFMQAAAQGISMFAAAGDSGASDGQAGNNNADYPSSSAYVTASNGTQLTIANLAGDYGSEVAWNDSSCFGNGPASTGGGISAVIPEPSWQTGPGVPPSTARMNSDVALTASCSHPLILVLDAQYYLTAGTSAVAPQLAGIFSIAVSQNGSSLGQSNSLLYDDVNAGDYATDFHDITSGCNGLLPDGSPSCAGTNWDHPTGWGSLNVANLLSHIGIAGPKGTLAGTVTAAASGSAIAGARVLATGPGTSANTYAAITAGDGTYLRVLPVGSYSVSVSDYGYATATAAEAISNGQTTTANFALQTAPMTTLHGVVHDDSGHQYGLLAELKFSFAGVGQVADVWTDPQGHYSVQLPEGTYTVSVAAAFDGYNTASQSVTLASGDMSKSFPLTVTSTCSAPGYAFLASGISEDFNGANFPPSGWAVTNPDAGNVVWELDSQEPENSSNYTGGTGTSADADSNANNSTGEPFDTSLVTPPIPVTSLHGVSTLTYKLNYAPYTGNDELDLDISSDGGTTWNTITPFTTDQGGFMSTPGVDEQVDLAPYLPASGNFQLRWRYYSLASGSGYYWDYYAQIDDVSTVGCAPLPGGIVYGGVTDAKTGKGLVGAAVFDDTGAKMETVSNAFDPQLPSGFYMYFAKNGSRTLTVKYPPYAPATRTVAVDDNEVVSAPVSFALKSATFAANPASFTENVKVNSTATVPLVLRNTGDGTGQFQIFGMNSVAPAIGQYGIGGVPLHLIPWHYSATNLRSQGRQGRIEPAAGSIALAPAGPNSAWKAISSLPIPVVDSCAAVVNGKVYEFTGLSHGANTPNDYVYDPLLDTWSPIADFPNGGLDKPACAAVNGKVYITNGDTPPPDYLESDVLYIYDPASDSFSTGAPIPSVLSEFGASGVGLNGEFYVIGGVNGAAGFPETERVAVYDPTSNVWSTAANYPTKIAYAGCGAVNGVIVCAGGEYVNNNEFEETAATYIYDPSSDSWSQGADMPYANWAMSATATNSKLLLSQGLTGGEITNQTAIYDLPSNTWINGPNNVVSTFRGAGACGFYTIGGMATTGTNPSDGIVYAEELPGYCGGGTGIPWLTFAPAQGTLAPGASTTIALSFDGSKQKEFTTTHAYLQVNGAPQPRIIPITVNWVPQLVDLDISGNVSPTGTVNKGDTLTYTVMVQNLPNAEGSATQTKLIYQIPTNVNYIAANGAVCAPSGSARLSASGEAGRITGAPIAASVVGPAAVTCDLGTIAPNKGDLITIGVRATAAASSISATFTAQAREPDSDSSNNTFTLETNPAAGPPGPPGPPGPKGDKGGSGALAFGGIGLLALLALSVGAVETRKRSNWRQRD